ncbi:hypothetical protein ACOBR2_05960 [Telmatobacter bradus]|uniref:hypothetical protein n=1 Tax=Telmatobacter bradus TaxID=474953 RepID=UPI003B42E5CC
MKSPIPVTLGILAVVLMVLLMSKIANDPHVGQTDNHSFWLSGQRVLQCSPTEITLIDNRYAQTHLLKDENSWPDCSTFEGNQTLDLFLSRGEHTHFIKAQKSSWWN